MGNIKTYPPVVVVDEFDNEIGAAMLDDTLQKGLYHRIASVIITDENGRMLLQRRSNEVKLYPGCWDLAVGGHVDAGQTYLDTAIAETEEEIGLAGLELKELGTIKSNDVRGEQTINTFERFYSAEIPDNTNLSADPDEIAGLKWFSPDELSQLITTSPDMFAAGLIIGLERFFPDFINSAKVTQPVLN